MIKHDGESDIMKDISDIPDPAGPSESVKRYKTASDARRRLETKLEEARLLKELSEDEYYK